MKFLDSFKMAIHNLWHNKSRSILTITIVFVVSLLIMAMILLGSNFITNQETANMQVFEKMGTTYNLEIKNNFYSDEHRYEDSVENAKRQSDSSEALKIMEKSVKYNDVIDTCYYVADSFEGIKIGDRELGFNSQDFAYTAFDFPFNTSVGKLLEGRIYNSSDVNTNNIWVNSRVVQNATALGAKLGIGDKIIVKLRPRAYEGEYIPYEKIAFIEYNVAGIYESVENDNIYDYSTPPVFMACARYTTQKFENISMGIRLFISYSPVVGSYDFSDCEKSMSAFVKEANAEIGKGKDYYNKDTDRFSCQILEDMKMSRVLGLVILGMVTVLAFIVLLLSIGSIANTIIISVDKNRKFIGLMKAMGLNNKGVKGIVYKEAFISITIGITLATIAIFFVKGLILNLLQKMFGSLFGMYGIETVITFSFNFLIPIGTLLAFIGMAVLFSKGALNKMGKADPIAIISEVA